MTDLSTRAEERELIHEREEERARLLHELVSYLEHLSLEELTTLVRAGRAIVGARS